MCEDSVYSAVCRACDTGVRTDEPNETIAFFRRHRRVTDHDVEIGFADGSAPAELEDADVLTVVRELQSTYDTGVPVGVVAAVMGEHGCPIDGTIDRIHERRMDGTLYEPTDGHLRAF